MLIHYLFLVYALRTKNFQQNSLSGLKVKWKLFEMYSQYIKSVHLDQKYTEHKLETHIRHKSDW